MQKRKLFISKPHKPPGRHRCREEN